MASFLSNLLDKIIGPATEKETVNISAPTINKPEPLLKSPTTPEPKRDTEDFLMHMNAENEEKFLEAVHGFAKVIKAPSATSRPASTKTESETQITPR